MKKKYIITSVFLLCVFITALANVEAAEGLLLFHNTVKDEMIYAYVENPGEYEQVECQIGQDYASDVSIKSMTDPDISISTYILIDNSLSVQEKYRETMKQVAKDVIFSGKDNELFTVATFDTEIHYLIENSKDSEALIQAVENIEFQNLDTQVTNVLYHLCEKIEDEDENNYKRIILMSDGVETKSIGYTKEELIERVKRDAYPIYVLGCTYKSNETELENMFRISRETNAEYFYLDDVESAEQVAAGIDSSFNMVRVQARIPESQCDGASKGIKIIFESGDNEKSVSFYQAMPFRTKSFSEDMTEEMETTENDIYDTETELITESVGEQQEAIAESEKISEKITEQESEKITEDIMEQTSKSGLINKLTEQKKLIWIGLILAAVLLILSMMIILLKKKNKNQNSETQLEFEETEKDKDEEKTELLEDNKTLILNRQDASKGEDIVNIRLTDVKRPSVAIEYPLKNSVIIGREPGKSQIVFDYERSVSGKHCEISRSENKIFIQDLDSSNQTYVDEKLVTDKMELADECVIKMGRLLVKFQNLDPEKTERSENGNEPHTKYMFDIYRDSENGE